MGDLLRSGLLVDPVLLEVSGLRAQGSENEPLQLLKKGVQHLAYFFRETRRCDERLRVTETEFGGDNQLRLDFENGTAGDCQKLLVLAASTTTITFRNVACCRDSGSP